MGNEFFGGWKRQPNNRNPSANPAKASDSEFTRRNLARWGCNQDWEILQLQGIIGCYYAPLPVSASRSKHLCTLVRRKSKNNFEDLLKNIGPRPLQKRDHLRLTPHSVRSRKNVSKKMSRREARHRLGHAKLELRDSAIRSPTVQCRVCHKSFETRQYQQNCNHWISGCNSPKIPK